MATLVKLDYSGKDINVYMPVLGQYPERNVALRYDKEKFIFNVISKAGKTIGKISATQVLNNIENNLFKICK